MKKYISVFLLFVATLILMGLYGPGSDPEDHRTMIPIADNTYDIGSPDRAYRRVYIGSTDQYINAFNKALPLDLLSFTTGGVTLTGSTTPKLATNNAQTSIVWVDGDLDPIEQTFRVPADYNSDGAFRVLADLSTQATDGQIDFDVYIQDISAAGAWDSSVTDQTPVAVKNDGSGGAYDVGSPELVTLTPATDFTGLAAGDYVTVRMWRRDTSFTPDLEVYYVEFYYN